MMCFHSRIVIFLYQRLLPYGIHMFEGVFMSLEKHISRELNLKVNEHLDIGNGQTGVYANHKWFDEKSNRVIIYYHDVPLGFKSNDAPRHIGDFIKVMGKTFEIEYWKEQKHEIATSWQQREMYDKARKKL